MKKITVATAVFFVVTASVAGCGTTDENAADPGRDPIDSADINQVNDQSREHDESEFTIDDRVERGERHGARNMRDGRGSFYYNNPQDVVDKDTYTAEERRANEERAHRYEVENGSQSEDIAQEIETMDHVEDAQVFVDNHHVLVGVRTDTDEQGQPLEEIEKWLQAEMTDKEILVTDSEEITKRLDNNASDETSESFQDLIDDIRNDS
ncbi:YhcN/YlaJ family sporulation lipoprotein [Natribacillus halophilus]|uniref:Sporulation lipoprotein YhcN/YlaJ (Spore_YhcN_YlaJ) n=1 Tax=Natribacillus halophilus TaxID=549003 RepID=A0A1G8R4C0_9BACI|nr:YhcN/YlaJ family sporulation lipoprotein [Natribacillus halophilus]SDJ11693.1 Sporulation lipoprotein YhcN/YlaJ (Spore_YhcN_YlaJ) [Natribacillus halophilus]